MTQLRPSFAMKTCFLKALAPVNGFSSGSKSFCKAASIFACAFINLCQCEGALQSSDMGRDRSLASSVLPYW